MKAQVLLPKIFNYPFIYESNKKGNIGDLVEVPFGTKKEIGIIWKNNRSEPKNIKIKNIKRFVKYSINKKLVNFIEWFSTYNMVSVGLVLKMVMGDSDKLDNPGHESTGVFNNAGTGHAANCELNYTPLDDHGNLKIEKALLINRSFEKSMS